MTEEHKAYQIIDVAETGKPYDQAMFDEVIKLRDTLYANEPEVESPDAIKLRLSDKNKKNDPVNLKINAIVADGEVKGFSILETYLDAAGKPISGCLTYASADPEFASAPGGIDALIDLHKASVKANYPIIVEINPGDADVIKNADNKYLHPFALHNNKDPLVVEMAIKLGVNPGDIDRRLVHQLKDHATAADQSAPLSEGQMKKMLEAGHLRDKEGNLMSVILPIRYNALNLDEDADPEHPFVGGPPNLHLAIVNAGKGLNLDDVEKGYCGLSQSILAGNGKEQLSTNQALEQLLKHDEFNQTLSETASLAIIHAQLKHKEERTGQPIGSDLQRQR